MTDRPERSLSWLDLLEPPTTADPMSRRAAHGIEHVAGELRRRVLRYIALEGPIAEWSIAEELELSGNTVRPRIWELRKLGLVEIEGQGLTPARRRCHLYIASGLGYHVLGLDQDLG